MVGIEFARKIYVKDGLQVAKLDSSSSTSGNKRIINP